MPHCRGALRSISLSGEKGKQIQNSKVRGIKGLSLSWYLTNLSSLFGSISEAYIWDQCSSGAQHKILLWHLSLVVAYFIILSLTRQLGGTYVPYAEQLFHEYLLALYMRMKSKGTSRRWYPLEVMRNLSLRKLRLSKGKIKEGSNVNQRVIWALEANKCINANFKGCK